MHELQQILLQKLPRLGELTFWCEIQYWDETMVYSHKNNDFFVFVRWNKTAWVDRNYEHAIKILGHPFSHSDLLEALGEDWAMTGDYQIMKKWVWDEWVHYDTSLSGDWKNFPKLPSNISDLSLPEYDETRKQLIQLLTK